MALSSKTIMMQVLILAVVLQFCSGFQFKRIQSRPPMFRRMAEESDKKVDKGLGSAYFQGLITEPIAPLITTKANGKERDNLTPNIKFAAILSGMIGGLYALFMYANKDLVPPPY